MRSLSTRGTRRLRVGAVVASALLLGACGGIHPGEAVVVGSDSITMKRLDDLSGSYCKLAVVVNSQQGNTQAVSGGDARRQAAQALVANLVAQRVAKQEGVSVPASQYTLSEDQLSQVRKAFKGVDIEGVSQVLQLSQQTSLLFAAIGGKELGTEVTSANQQQAQTEGQKAVQAQIKKDDPSVDPRLGLDLTSSDATATSGSLSVGVSDLSKAKADDLAASQRCS